MPPRTRNPKALKASRGAATPSHSVNVPTSYPWPNKAEGQPININDPLLLDYNCEGWDKESAARYNRLLAAEILPTRFAHAETLAALGLESDVFETLDVMGQYAALQSAFDIHATGHGNALSVSGWPALLDLEGMRRHKGSEAETS